MEQKKKRPRISKSGTGFSLKERPKTFFPNSDRNRSEDGERKPFNRDDRRSNDRRSFDRKPYGQRPFRKRDDFHVEKKPKPTLPSGEGMPLNKYLAHCGASSRRKAVEFIEAGQVTVNGEVKLEPYYRVEKGDVVVYDGKEMRVQERPVYLLLNKPKNVITTTEDERGRTTVLDIVDPHYPERIYPVGRLDRDTTGLLVITNDGDLAAKLSHPSYKILKHYRVGLDKGLSEADFVRIVEGVELDDGEVPVNWVRFAEDHPERDVVELEIVVGRNRIVRRLFESLGYRVRKLDRFYYAGLTKRELPRGSFRELTQREIVMLKHFTGHPSTVAKKKEGNETENEAVEEKPKTAAKKSVKKTEDEAPAPKLVRKKKDESAEEKPKTTAKKASKKSDKTED
ncbi:MAG: pseudouridine synthase [Saprospiraceae bacterium]